MQISDPEVLAYIDACNRLFPETSGERHIAVQRRDYERMANAFRAPRPEGLAIEDTIFRGPAGFGQARRYWPANPLETRVLFFHGGGFSLGSVDSHDSICAEIAARTDCEVISINYRLAPEHPHPAAYADALAAVATFGDRPLIVAGDSAGGNIAAALGLTGDARIVGQVLIYPDLGGISLELPSYAEKAEAPLLTTSDVRKYRRGRCEQKPPERDETFDPLMAMDFESAAPCFISAAEHDPLRDDGPEYVLRLTEAGIAAEVVVEEELPHGHLRARHKVARAGAAFGRICDAITRMATAD
ncbi:MAG: alpha/beta hydrolase [Pseudomonadota bacterium]